MIEGVKTRDMNTGYRGYDLPVSEIDGSEVAVSLCFCRFGLKELRFAFSDPESYGSDWDEWSEENEKVRASDTGVWLKNMGFPPGRYWWGEIWAEYESQSASGYAGVRFRCILS